MVMVVMTTYPVAPIGPVLPSSPAGRLRQILQVRQLTGLRSRSEVRRQLGELGRRISISISCSGLRGGCQVRRDSLGDLLILGWVGLLQLLQSACQLRERRKLAVVRLVRERPIGIGAKRVVALIRRHSVGLEGVIENRLQIAA